jgi:hypothetical protein
MEDWIGFIWLEKSPVVVVVVNTVMNILVP